MTPLAFVSEHARVRHVDERSRSARCLAIACALALVAVCGGASAQDRERGTFVYREGPRTRQVTRDADGSVWLEANGRRFAAAIGTERVILVGAHDAQDVAGLDVVLDEVLSEGAGIVAVRSTRPREGALALASRLASAVDAGRFEGATPDLALPHVLHDIDVPPNDPSFDAQWFYETIGMTDAWSLEDGDPSVTIAVIDTGCDERHRDLFSQLLPGYDAIEDRNEGGFVPDEWGNHHGTACAGLAAASTDNGMDIAGTCPECSLRCIRLIEDVLEPTAMSADVRAFDFVLESRDVAVVSNSWGFYAGVPVPLPLATVIARVISSGHGGRGALVVFSAGNDGEAIGSDELPAIRGVITVGATDESDEIRDYSNSGECLAIAAPTGEVTLDISGADGSGAGSTTTTFGGTSSSCPIVAGVLGLMVSAAPSMSPDDLRDALTSSARRVPSARPDATGHDLHFGFGVVDAHAAVSAVLPPPPDAGPSMDAGASVDADVDADLDADRGLDAPEPIDARRIPRDIGPRTSGGPSCDCRVAESQARCAPLLLSALAVCAAMARGRRRARGLDMRRMS